MANQIDEAKPISDLEIMRHSAAHIMAEAVLSMFPEAKLGIGPAIDTGFYYDFDLPRTLTPEDLPEIETRMNQLVKANLPFRREEMSKDEARKLFADQPYKLELLDDIPDEIVSVYRQGNLCDLCRGPHVNYTSKVKAFKLLSIAGAYWRGDEKRPMLQRIYGAAFLDKASLAEYLNMLEESAKRDHRKLGKELELFSLHQEIGGGLVNWLPNGAIVRHLIEEFWKKEHLKRGYSLVYTPHIAKVDLWKTSGHWGFYRENMYSPMDIDGEEYVLKPMNCVYHILMFKNRTRSYKELPIRMAELGTVYRYERSGVLHGLSRVRGFTQDDAHIFCLYEQLEKEVVKVLDLAKFMIDTFGFTRYKVMLSTRPEKYVGELDKWEYATDILAKALESNQIAYQVDPGEGVFYGPKIDIKFEDALGRAWQGPTIQVDFQLPERFDVSVVGEDGKDQPVAMVHRTVLGSMERFMSCLTEQYGGAFPVWLSPKQVMLIPIADRHSEFAEKLACELREEEVRVEVDNRSETMNQKIRQAQLAKIPYMLVVGDKEIETQSVSIRTRSGSQCVMPFAEFKSMLIDKIKTKSTEI
ncbi:threonine--tRNA ligase [Dehalococcoides mccartyi]|uniref:Threonine--tRNA ligase n=1 Tax=Dehalococcoides mccartyi (strain ATCC BAA-2266 / KCTC 15142 / 195) TaxID=243164 RepID=SYT_DEHM1|nr:threonine--tRNA ligase [Dehalococcoides mccartyi]Q3Z8G2.1 RecName: Full=Threonine--tRNA ligase; AltName: Full=Threonyl-tRNA synthetase; Short=ThrRS [Dehalococcoides mccartyi 195]AAW39977.1 threonyl-tRNA synthetase [Dehalococcoides mccartyi 195]